MRSLLAAAVAVLFAGPAAAVSVTVDVPANVSTVTVPVTLERPTDGTVDVFFATNRRVGGVTATVSNAAAPATGTVQLEGTDGISRVFGLATSDNEVNAIETLTADYVGFLQQFQVLVARPADPLPLDAFTVEVTLGEAPSEVPLPAGAALLMAGLGSLAWARRRH